MQARAFEAINGSTIKVTTQQRFRAAVAAGDAEAVQLRDVASRARINILGGIPSTLLVKPGDCIAITALQRVMAVFDAGQAQLVFECIRLTVTRPKILIRNDMILAAVDAFTEHPEWFTTPNIKAGFARLDQEKLFSAARELAAREENVRIRDMLSILLGEEIDEWVQSRGAA